MPTSSSIRVRGLTPAPTSTRDRILAAAERRLRSAPLDELKLAAVARSAGVSRQTLYEYFRDRDDLVASVFVAQAEARLVPRRQEIIDEDPTAKGLERVFWEDIEVSRAFFADVDPASPVRWGVADFMLRSERMREYERTMWRSVLERLAGEGVLATGLDLDAAARWLAYQQTWLVIAPKAIDEDEKAIREHVRRFVIAPLLR